MHNEIIDNFLKENDLLTRLEKHSRSKKIPVVGQNTGSFLAFAVKIKNPSAVLEIGCGSGFSTYFLFKTLNKKFLKRSYPTDVLAFNFKEEKAPKRTIFGEIVISAETVARNARHFGQSSKKELTLCVIHGILHLLGYDDLKVRDKKRMRYREQQLLNLIKI